jgi:hypothetical protein
MGLFEKAAGCRGGAPLMSLPEVSMKYLKTIYLFCFCFLKDDLVNPNHLLGVFEIL